MSSRSIRAKQFIFLSTLLYIHLLTVRGGYQEHIIHRHCDRRGPCLNLSTIVDNTSIYPNSNTTLIFQQGDHYLDSELDVSGKEFLVLSTNQSSESFSILYCRDNDRLKFSNISQLRMRSLKFIRCSIIVDRFNLEDSSFDGENANSSALQLSQTNVESLQRNFASFKLMCFVCYSYDVMKRCWNANKTDQPLFTTLHKTLQDYSTSEDLTNLISLQNIDSYYQPRRHQSVRGIGGERLERRQQGEDGLESREEGRQGEEGGEIVTVMADGASGKNLKLEIISKLFKYYDYGFLLATNGYLNEKKLLIG